MHTEHPEPILPSTYEWSKPQPVAEKRLLIIPDGTLSRMPCVRTTDYWATGAMMGGHPVLDYTHLKF